MFQSFYMCLPCRYHLLPMFIDVCPKVSKEPLPWSSPAVGIAELRGGIHQAHINGLRDGPTVGVYRRLPLQKNPGKINQKINQKWRLFKKLGKSPVGKMLKFQRISLLQWGNDHQWSFTFQTEKHEWSQMEALSFRWKKTPCKYGEHSVILKCRAWLYACLCGTTNR